MGHNYNPLYLWSKCSSLQSRPYAQVHSSLIFKELSDTSLESKKFQDCDSVQRVLDKARIPVEVLVKGQPNLNNEPPLVFVKGLVTIQCKSSRQIEMQDTSVPQRHILFART